MLDATKLTKLKYISIFMKCIARGKKMKGIVQIRVEPLGQEAFYVTLPSGARASQLYAALLSAFYRTRVMSDEEREDFLARGGWGEIGMASIFRVIHAGRQLDSSVSYGDRLLSEYGIDDGSTIHLVNRLRGKSKLTDAEVPSSVCSNCGEHGATKRCARCKSSIYCSKDCQAEHWHAGHKNEC